MKQLLYRPMDIYFVRGRTNTATINRWLNHYVRHFSALTAFQKVRPAVLTKPKSIPNKQKNIYAEKKFSSGSSDSKSLILMDFDVWAVPKLSRALTSLYNYFFVLKGVDDSFSFAEFSRCSTTALQVVTSLLSELRFSELDGLLTEECKQEVKKNLNYWPKQEVSVLAVDPNKIFRIFPCDIVVFSDKNEKEFVEIRVIHYVWLKYSAVFKKSDFSQTPIGKKVFNDIIAQGKLRNIYMYGIFNSKFIKEITKGVTDQWTINAINLQCYSDFISV